MTSVNDGVYMKVRSLYPKTGPSGHAVWALTLDSGRCPARNFIDRQKKERPKVWKRIEATLKFHALKGIVFNETVSRPIKGKKYQGLREFKISVSGQGTARLIYFMHKGGTVLTVCCFKVKEKEFRQAADSALNLRERFLTEGTFK